jgi:uncharacterized protein (DUF1330 family)
VSLKDTNNKEVSMEAKNEHSAVAEAKESAARRYYQVVFIWMKDPVTFGRYRELLGPVVQRYGGGLERMLAPDTIYAEGMPKPDIVNIVFYDDSDAFAAFNKDPEFEQIVHLRSESIDMVSVAGLPIGGAVTQEELAKRRYLVEVARFGPQGATGYQHYEAQAEPVMNRYGYHVERRLAPDLASGFPFEPDLVKVAYFDSPDGIERFHTDAAHHHIENELYSAAVQQSVWVVGQVHPMMLGEKP